MSGWRVTGSCVLVALALQARAGETPASREAALRRALGLLDYVAGDYEAAVSPRGQVVDAHEYAEQLEFLEQVEDLLRAGLGRKGGAVVSEVRALHAACAERRPPSEFVPRIRQLHGRIVRESGLRFTPQHVPSLLAGRILYGQFCASCHGDDGTGDTQTARSLVPRPMNFRDPRLDAHLTPLLVHDVVTFGIPGTAMASLATLEDEERWDLAFYVLALRHDAVALGPQAAAPAGRAAAVPSLTVRDLALATDADLGARLAGWPPAAKAEQNARWRRTVPLALGTEERGYGFVAVPALLPAGRDGPHQ